MGPLLQLKPITHYFPYGSKHTNIVPTLWPKVHTLGDLRPKDLGEVSDPRSHRVLTITYAIRALAMGAKSSK